MIEKWKDKFPKDFFTKESERIRVIEDTDGDGKADKVTTFAEDFRDPVDGPAAGVLVMNNRVYFTNIPKIWGFDDKNDDLKADTEDGCVCRVSDVKRALVGSPTVVPVVLVQGGAAG